MANQELDSGLVKPTLGMAKPSRYRNKMGLTFGADGALGMNLAMNLRQPDVDLWGHVGGVIGGLIFAWLLIPQTSTNVVNF